MSFYLNVLLSKRLSFKIHLITRITGVRNSELIVPVVFYDYESVMGIIRSNMRCGVFVNVSVKSVALMQLVDINSDINNYIVCLDVCMVFSYRSGTQPARNDSAQ